MSVSSFGNTSYKPFGIKPLHSIDGSEDSYVFRSRSVSRTIPAGASAETTTHLSELLSYFRYCCAPLQRGSGSAPSNLSDFKVGDVLGNASASIQQSVSNAAAYTGINKFISLDESTASDDEGSTTVKNEPVDKVETWRIKTKGESLPPVLTPEQTRYAILLWCASVERGEKMSEKMLSNVLYEASYERKNIDINHQLKSDNEFDIVELLRIVEGRDIQNILGDVCSIYGALESSRGMYGIISKGMCIGICARNKGGAFDGCIFAPAAREGERFVPSFIGYDSFEDMGAAIENIFNSEVPVSQVGSERYTAWLLQSKNKYEDLPTAEWEEGAGNTLKDVIQYEEWAKGQKDEFSDPKFDVKRLYTDMYNLTTGNTTDTAPYSSE